MNFKVFPAGINKEGQKVPLINGWQTKASNDPEQIQQWKEFFRDRLKFFGIPCGPDNGVMVLDVDVKKENGLETIQKNNLIIPETIWQQTPSKGYHFLFQYDPSREVGNRVGFLPSLDTRSKGGWIASYNLDFSKPLAPMPQWIYEACQKKQKELSPSATVLSVSPEIGMEIFNSALEAIREAPPGESNNTLNVQSYLVGQLIASGGVSREYAEQELFKAAKERGKPDYEAQATITSGIEGGLRHPKVAELPSGPPVPLIRIESPIPAAPEVRERWTPKFITRSQLFNTSKLRKPQLFEDWSTEDIHITSADGGTGKTTLKLYEAVCLALGSPFLGFQCVTPGRTLFITGEDTAEKLSAMLGQILKQMGLMDGTPESDAKVDHVLNSIVIKKDADLCIISKDRSNGFLTVNKDAVSKLMEAIEDLNPKMIVFDPIASFWGSESALNDMNKAVAKFMGELQEKSNACVEMINHIGKQSSSMKDLTQFAGRGGTGLPSHARVVRVLIGISPEEYREKTGFELEENKSAMLCNIGKFSDGSPLYNKPFIIVRCGYLFERQLIIAGKDKVEQSSQHDLERIMSVVKDTLRNGNYPTISGITGYFRSHEEPISVTKVKDCISLLGMNGLYGERVKTVAHPDATVKEKILVIEQTQPQI